MNQPVPSASQSSTRLERADLPGANVGSGAGDDEGVHPDCVEFVAHFEAMADRLDRVADLERQICALQADQVEEVAHYIDDQMAYSQRPGQRSGPEQHRGMVAEIAIARHVSVITAESFMSDAYLLATSHPCTMQALRVGRLGLPAARAIVNETVFLETPELIRAADRLIAAEATDVLPGKLCALAERRVTCLDPTAATRRRHTAKADRHVRLTDVGSGMTHFGAFLPAEQGAACIESLRGAAVKARAVPRRQGRPPHARPTRSRHRCRHLDHAVGAGAATCRHPRSAPAPAASPRCT